MYRGIFDGNFFTQPVKTFMFVFKLGLVVKPPRQTMLVDE